MSLTYRRPKASGLGCEPGAGRASSRAVHYLACKSSADLMAASFLLVMLAPLILILMILVKLTSRGPAIYEQVRLGRDGRPFRIYKLRSMVHDCERLSGPRWAGSADPRTTSLGRFLRRSHLDELPQLWNVVKGDMSLVGPRPERPEFVEKLELDLPNYRERLAVAPGITGLAQVQLPPDEGTDDVRRKVRCDLVYVDRMGLELDLKIMAGTVLKVLGCPFESIRRSLRLPGVEDFETTAAVSNVAAT